MPKSRFLTQHPRLWQGLKVTAICLAVGVVAATILYFSGGLAAIPFLAPVVAKIGAAIIAAAIPVFAAVTAGLWYGVFKPLAKLFRRPKLSKQPILVAAPKTDNPIVAPNNSLKISTQLQPPPIPASSNPPIQNTQTKPGEVKNQEPPSNALILKGYKVDLSYMYDGLTIYYDKTGVDCALDACLRRTRQMKFVQGRGYLCESAASTVNTPLVDIGKTRVWQIPGLEHQRYIHRSEDDHSLYHQDVFDVERDHQHIKFKYPLNANQFAEIINIFAQEGLIKEEQKRTYLEAFHQRMAHARAALDGVCRGYIGAPGRKQKDTQAILNFIRTIPNNDVLVNLHEYLLNPNFDYLRTLTETHPTPGKVWQGIDPSGQVVITSQAWAKLEKAISLQMIRNLRTQASNFSTNFGKERAEQLAEAHRFFGIKRSRYQADLKRPRTFKTQEAFATANTQTLDRKYNKVFGGN